MPTSSGWLQTSRRTRSCARKKTLSLSLAKRKAERETADADQLRRENERRKAQGKPVFASLAEMETLRAGSAPLTTMTQAEMKALGTVTQAEMEALVAPAGTTKPVPADSKAAAAIAAEKEPDILLDSTTQIMGDIVAGITPTAAPRTAQRESNSGTTSAN